MLSWEIDEWGKLEEKERKSRELTLLVNSSGKETGREEEEGVYLMMARKKRNRKKKEESVADNISAMQYEDEPKLDDWYIVNPNEFGSVSKAGFYSTASIQFSLEYFFSSFENSRAKRM